MITTVLRCCWIGFVSLSVLNGWASVSQAESPRWIGGAVDASRWQFAKSVALTRPVQAAKLKVAADFCHASVRVNDQIVLALEPHCPAQEIDITQQWRRGENRLTMEATRVPGPAAVALSVEVVHTDRSVSVVGTDASWSGAGDLGAVPAESWGLGRRSIAISPFDNYEQWQQAKGGTADQTPRFWVAPGFEVTEVRRATADEGSWIALTFDSAGRAIVSREDVGLLRMTLAADRQSVASVESVPIDLAECRGLVWVGDELYANANNSKGMYRVRIGANPTDTSVERLREFPGGVGHGRNDLTLGAENWLYSIHGDSVDKPAAPVLDRTSPLRESRRGKPQREGTVVRFDSKQGTWELFCTGLRNPYGITANAHGELFTYDADNEYDMGMPWYRPTRIVQLVSGADYGWRVTQGSWPPYAVDRPEHVPPTLDIGRGSPTAVLCGTSLDFPEPYRSALFALDWSYGRVLSIHLAARGAGYRASSELFMQGKPLNVTDVAAGPDGALWLITGGRKTQSALYRVAVKTPREESTVKREPSEHERACDEFSTQRRTWRRKLAELHGRTADNINADALASLEDLDPLVRYTARTALEHVARDHWQALSDIAQSPAVEREQDVVKKLEVLLMQSRTGDASLVPGILEQLLRLPTERLNLSARFVTVHLVAQCLALAPAATQTHARALVERLIEFWPEPAREGLRVSPHGTNLVLRRRLALVLADLGASHIVPRVVDSLCSSVVQEDRWQGLLALRQVRDGWTPQLRARFFQTFAQAPKSVGGEGMPTFVQKLRTDLEATLTESERQQLATLLAKDAAADDPVAAPRPVVKNWTKEDLAKVAEQTSRGDAERGAKVFRDALCGRCHRAGAVGPAVGPDLTFAARRFSRADLLDAILTPSKSVAENYRNVQVVTVSGKVHVGRLVEEGDFRKETLVLNIDPLRAGQLVRIDKKEVAEERLHETSPMPQGLLDGFSEAEIEDLLAFLESGGTNAQAVKPN